MIPRPTCYTENISLFHLNVSVEVSLFYSKNIKIRQITGTKKRMNISWKTQLDECEVIATMRKGISVCLCVTFHSVIT